MTTPLETVTALHLAARACATSDDLLAIAEARQAAHVDAEENPLAPHLGKVAIVTGAAGGIGRATAERLHADGAVVVGLDINPAVAEHLNQPGLSGKVCDLTDNEALRAAIDAVVTEYGGLDLVVANAGIFKAGETIEQLGPMWDLHLKINLTATQRLLHDTIPYLKFGITPSIIIMGSRNFSAPGPGASAYSVTKAGVTQLARVAALELAGDGIRVNTIHPDAVFDTELWTEAALAKSAERYGMTVQEYKTKNLLHIEIKSTDIARMVSVVAGPTFRATTGAQIPIDGGNDRVI
jgi:NAD(P)-dependent dehydrogenase (short-subunit alcohol dehydrogenase family)